MTGAHPSHQADLARFLTALADGAVEFVVCGGVACVLHGVSRVTNDLDLCLRMSTHNLERFVDVAREFNLMPRAPVSLEALLDPETRRVWIEEKHATVFTLVSLQTPLQVDVMLEYPIPFDRLVEGADTMTAARVSLKVSSKEQLIEAKRSVNPVRKVDLRDIEDLQELIERGRQRPAKPG